MALNTTLSSGLSAEMKTFYDRVLLERTVPELLYQKFGQRKEIPRNGGKTIEFRRFSNIAVAKTPLAEGVPYTALKDLTVTAVTASVSQYGDAMGFSDLVSTTTIDSVLTEATEILGDQAAETIDELVRDVVVAGTSIIYANGRLTRGTVLATEYITAADLRKIALQMKLNRAKKIDGYWQVICHPRVAHDLMATTEWREAQLYGNTGRIFDGSLGTLYGFKFWETDKAPSVAGVGAGGQALYQTMIFGQHAFGVVGLSGHNLRTVYKALGSAGTADALDQQQTMGWKVTFTTKILNDLFMIRYESSVSTS